MTKPVTAVATMLLVDDGRIRLDDPVDDWLPELADRRVMVTPSGSLDDTVAADRAITVRDLLTFRFGLGMDFTEWGNQPVLDALAGARARSRPARPGHGPGPGRVHAAARHGPARAAARRALDVQHGLPRCWGCWWPRVAGQPFDDFLRQRIFEPLGMADTAFSVPGAELARFGACYVGDAGTGGRQVFDPADGQWSRRPAFPDGAAGLVSTVEDFLRFGEMLIGGGDLDGTRILSASAIGEMTTNQLTDDQLRTAGPDPDGLVGWGLGCGVRVRSTEGGRSIGTYGWDGGLGSSWHNDPVRGIVGVLMTDQMWTSPTPPPICEDFWRAVYEAVDGPARPNPARPSPARPSPARDS